jgi:hypothetical protein
MKVGELIDALSALPEDATVLVASDEEGNRISELYSADTQKFIDYGEGEINLIHPDDEDDYEDDDPSLAVVLWP